MKGKINTANKTCIFVKPNNVSKMCEVISTYFVSVVCFLFLSFRRNDKVIVFSDNVFALKKYAEKLKK